MDMSPSATLRRETRLLSVSGAWVRGTWVDDAVLEHCRRSAQGGFGFRVRSSQVGHALVDAGLADRDRRDPSLLTGTSLAGGLDAATVAPPASGATARPPRAGFVAEPRAAAAPAAAAPRPTVPDAEEFLGFCASAHHASPVEATVSGLRQSNGAARAHTEAVVLCGRCADMLGSAGFFTAR